MREFSSSEASSLYQLYLRGWRDGAAFRALDPSLRHHANEKFREAYERGYSEGREALNAAGKIASERYGYTPSILRTQPLGRP